MNVIEETDDSKILEGVIKTENIMEEVTDKDALSTVEVGSGVEYMENNVPPNEGLESIKNVHITFHDAEMTIKTEINDINEELGMGKHELSFELLSDVKIEDVMIENGRKYMEDIASKCYVLLNKLDFDHEQYLNDIEIINEQNIKTEYPSNSSEVDTEKQSAVQLYQRNCSKYGTDVRRNHKAKDESTSQTDMNVTHEANVNYFKCQFCEYITKHIRKLKMHFTAKHSESAKLYHCSNCKYKTKVRKNLVKHIVQHNKKTKWHQCRLCNFKGKYKSQLLQHHKLKHDDAAEIFHCYLCEFKTKHKNSFLQHHRLKHDAAAEIFHCVLCDFKTKNKSILLQHHRSKHDDTGEIFNCKLCHFKTKKEHYLLLHCRRQHDDAAKVFCCELCDFKTKHKQRLSTHHKLIHEDVAEIFYCKMCDFKTNNKYSLSEHHKLKYRLKYSTVNSAN